MSAVIHKDLPASERHAIHSYEFADSAARLANNDYAATDMLRIAVQRDDNTVWMLTGITNPGATATPAWTQVGSASATVDANSTIAGNPPAFDTPGKMTAAIQALQAFLKDTNLDGRLDPENQESRPFDFPTAQSTWIINHNYGREPEITCYDNSGNVLDQPPTEHPTQNTTLIYWLVPQAGKAVLS